MSGGRSARDVDDLHARLSLLGQVIERGSGRLPAEVQDRAGQTFGAATARLGHGTSHTVVALAGATGSGKSSLFNAITGTELATVGVRRPTTSTALAAVFGDGADALLDWLAVPNRQRLWPTGAIGSVGASELSASEMAGELEGLVLLDLPDHDSTADAHRAEVDRLVQVVDVFAWVVDPQKYADAALHDQYLRQFAGHSAVTMVLLNQIDRLDPSARTACVDDLGRLLVADGLRGVRVLPVSATTGEGIAPLRRELAARVAERRAIVKRIDADLDWLANDLSAALGDAADGKVSAAARERLVEAAAGAAGGDEISAAVEAAYRHRGSLAVGWPPVRWVRRIRPDPLARLGLGTPAATRNAGGRSDERRGARSAGITVRRTAVSANPLAEARLGEALRDVQRAVTDSLPDQPRAAIDAVVSAAGDRLPDALDEAAGRTDLHVDAPRWWSLLGVVQRLATAAMVVGLLWLLVLGVLGWFKLPDPPLPKVRAIALPTLLAIGGTVIGLLVAVLGRRLARVGARRRARRALQALADEVAVAVDREVVVPLNAELTRLAELGRLVRKLAVGSLGRV